MSSRATDFAPEAFTEPVAALARVCEIYGRAVTHLRHGPQRYVNGEDVGRHVRA